MTRIKKDKAGKVIVLSVSLCKSEIAKKYSKCMQTTYFYSGKYLTVLTNFLNSISLQILLL